MMVGMSGEPPRKDDLSPTRLIALGLVVSMVSFAGFRLATDTKPQAPASAQGIVTASIPSLVPNILSPRLTASDPNLPQSSSSTVASPEPVSAPADISSLLTPPVLEAPSLAAVPEFRDVEHHFLTGETFAGVLSRYGVSTSNATGWIRAAARVYALAQIRAGQRLSMRVDVAASDLVSLEMGVDSSTNLVARRREGVIVATREPIEMGRVRRVVQGTIDTSFYGSAARADVPDEIISEVAEVLGWDLNFEKLQSGAKFQIQFEELHRPDDGGKIGGQLLAVRIVQANGKVHEGIWYQQPGDKAGSYYTSKGQALGRDYLRFPVSFTRISSNFSSARLHPVLKRTRPHYGVDFAAPTGTPVRAVAEGVVTMANWHGGNGRYIQLRHDDTFESGYGHLSRIVSMVRPGARVRKGDIIGYVGSTGLATGPHLHFVMYKNGKYIDPLSAAAPRSRSLTGEGARRFTDSVRKLDAAFAAAERAGGQLVLASSGPGTDTAALR